MDFQQDLRLIVFLWKYIYGCVFASLTAEILTVDGAVLITLFIFDCKHWKKLFAPLVIPLVFHLHMEDFESILCAFISVRDEQL